MRKYAEKRLNDTSQSGIARSQGTVKSARESKPQSQLGAEDLDPSSDFSSINAFVEAKNANDREGFIQRSHER